MSLFENLTTEGLEESGDRLGGFRVYDSDAYTGEITALYATYSANSKATAINLILKLDDGGEYRETFWITNKDGVNSYPDKQDKNKRHPLPGFTHIEDICLVTTNTPLSKQPTEDKVLNVWDPEAKKEVPKAVPMLVNVVGQKVTLGVLKLIRNKQVKDGSGNYVDTADTREENVTDKVFHHPSNLTVFEAKHGIQQAKFYGAWVEKNRGKTQDRTNKGAAASNGRAGAPPKAGDSQAPTTSLFGN